MSATAFQRLRREAAATMAKKQTAPTAEKPEDHVPTNKELMAILDEKGIEYNPKAKKEELLKLLEGAE